MACEMRISLTEESKSKAKKGLADLAARLKARLASFVIDPRTGAVAIRGWRAADIGMADSCAFRRILNNPETSGVARAALREAEAKSGRKLDPQATAHSHDGGHSWGPGH